MVTFPPSWFHTVNEFLCCHLYSITALTSLVCPPSEQTHPMFTLSLLVTCNTEHQWLLNLNLQHSSLSGLHKTRLISLHSGCASAPKQLAQTSGWRERERKRERAASKENKTSHNMDQSMAFEETNFNGKILKENIKHYSKSLEKGLWGESSTILEWHTTELLAEMMKKLLREDWKSVGDAGYELIKNSRKLGGREMK